MVNRNAARHLLLVVSILLCFFIYLGYRMRSPKADNAPATTQFASYEPDIDAPESVGAGAMRPPTDVSVPIDDDDTNWASSSGASDSFIASTPVGGMPLPPGGGSLRPGSTPHSGAITGLIPAPTGSDSPIASPTSPSVPSSVVPGGGDEDDYAFGDSAPWASDNGMPAPPGGVGQTPADDFESSPFPPLSPLSPMSQITPPGSGSLKPADEGQYSYIPPPAGGGVSSGSPLPTQGYPAQGYEEEESAFPSSPVRPGGAVLPPPSSPSSGGGAVVSTRPALPIPGAAGGASAPGAGGNGARVVPSAVRPGSATPPSRQNEQPSAPAPSRGNPYGPYQELPESLRIYVVLPGDTLSSIAARELGSISLAENIFLLNRDVIEDPDHLLAGVKIRLPVREGAALDAPSARPPGAGPNRRPAQGLGRTHVVVRGDTLSSISTQYYGSSSGWRQIYEANRAIVPNANQLVVGMELVIPPYQTN